MAQRRIPGLLAAGADVDVVSPEATPAVEGYATAGEIAWHAAAFEPGDLDGAWYVIAATDDRRVNDAVSAEAEERRIFCVRSDDATQATAWTPATGRHGPLTVAVLGSRDPRRSAAVRDEILDRLRDGRDRGAKDRHRDARGGAGRRRPGRPGPDHGRRPARARRRPTSSSPTGCAPRNCWPSSRRTSS